MYTLWQLRTLLCGSVNFLKSLLNLLPTWFAYELSHFPEILSQARSLLQNKIWNLHDKGSPLQKRYFPLSWSFTLLFHGCRQPLVLWTCWASSLVVDDEADSGRLRVGLHVLLGSFPSPWLLCLCFPLVLFQKIFAAFHSHSHPLGLSLPPLPSSMEI